MPYIELSRRNAIIVRRALAYSFNTLALLYTNMQFLQPPVTTVIAKSCNLIGRASYKVLGQLHVYHFTRLSRRCKRLGMRDYINVLPHLAEGGNLISF